MTEKTIHIKSFGCQMNKLDTALVESSLVKAGFGLTERVKDADAVVINTCSVRDHAEQKVISHLGHLAHIKKTKPNLTVAVIGCMAQRLGQKLLEYPAVDIVCGPAQIPKITELINTALLKKQKSAAITEKIRSALPAEDTDALEAFESVHDRADKRIPGQAFVRVMRGCNNFCSYCVVPYVRGPEVSRPPKLIIEQIKRLADEGVKQVTLLGQSVNSYEFVENGKTYCLADLLLMASDITGIEWIRFVTSYPQKKDFDNILAAMRDLPKVCNYLHMPVQSGSDKILKLMNRKYTSSQYLELLTKARQAVPDIALSGDFIVGFPGESDEDFAQTIKVVEQARYKNCFVFKYSPRVGTKADEKLQNTVAEEVKKSRNYELLKVQERISSELAEGFQDSVVRVLVEGLSKKAGLNISQNFNRPQLTGRTAGDWIVVFNSPVSLAGNFSYVKIVKTSPLTLFGEKT